METKSIYEDNISRRDEPTQYFVELKAEVIFTLPKTYIYKRLGKLSTKAMKEE